MTVNDTNVIRYGKYGTNLNGAVKQL